MIKSVHSTDQTILFFIQENFHFPLLDKIMILFTSAGDLGLVWIALSVVLLLNRNTRYIGILTLGALFLSVLLGEGILKNVIQRPRPYTDYPSFQMLVNQSSSYSFPSGHTITSFAAAYVLSRYLKKFSPLIWVLALIIAFSRLYLFMHYPSDIIAGIIFGLLCGKIIVYLYENSFLARIKGLD